MGWYTNNETLIRVLPIYVAMMYNTALSILLSGLSLIFLPTRYIYATRVLAVLTGILTLLISLQYLFNVDLHIDELFHTYNLGDDMRFPGRTSLNTSITLFLSSIAVYLLTYKGKEICSIIALVLSCFILSIPLVSLFGYLTGLEEAAGWSNFSRMALHTAVCCIIIGALILFWGVLNSLGSRKQLVTLPVATSIAVLASTFAIWQAFYTRDFLSVQRLTEKEAVSLKRSIESTLWSEIEAFHRITKRWDALGDYPQELWDIDTGNYLKDLTGLISIQAIDIHLKPIQSTQKSLPYPINQIELTQLQQGKNFISYEAKNAYIFLFSPLIIKGKFEGYLQGVIDLVLVLEKTFSSLDQFKYQVLATDQDHILFSENDSKLQKVGAPIVEPLNPTLAPVNLELFITKRAIKKESSGLSLFIFITGFVFTIGSGIFVYLAIVLKLKTSTLEILNKDLEMAKQRADEAAIMKSAFLATMSHEIRTPLNAVLGTVQLLAETNVDETQKKYIHRINFSSKALLNLINDILDFSKIESGSVKFENKPCDLMELIKNICEGFIVKVEQTKVDLLIDAPSQPIAQIITDAYRLEQIITNLITNAFKFTEKGSITLKMIPTSQDDSHMKVRFEVIDTGIGISQENTSKLFQKFSQIGYSRTKKSGGVGLGLSICKKLIEKMEGQIGVNSSEGNGSTFWFEISFPLADPKKQLESYQLKDKTIFLNDSNAKEQEILAKYLSDWQVKPLFEYKEDLSVSLAILSSDLQDMIQKIQGKNIPILYIEYEMGQQATDEKKRLIRPITSKSLWEALKQIIK